MKKSLYLLAALSLLGTNVFAKEVVAPAETSKEVIIEPVVIVEEAPVEEWKFTGRTYLETEDFDNNSKLNRSEIGFFEMEDLGDGADGTFWGTGISATKGKLTLDLNVERRYYGDLSNVTGGANDDATRVDWKIRYQLFEKQAFHIKYRNEKADANRRDRVELGTDWNYFNNMFAGWFVIGHDQDKNTHNGGKRSNGNYWEGEFGPTFKLNESLSLTTNLFTAGEFYDSYEMVETQIRISAPYQVNEKFSIMPRVRITLDKTLDTKNDKTNGDYVRDWEHNFGGRMRYELFANYSLTQNLSTTLGVAYEHSKRDYKNADILGGKNGKQSFNGWLTHIGLNYKFN